MVKNPLKYLSNLYRTNDCIKIHDGCFLYGVMRKSPRESDGAIIVIKNNIPKIVYEGIAIPNTFVVLKNTNSVLISDSLEKKIYKFSFNDNWDSILKRSLWLDLSATDCVPDGGCMSKGGDIYIAMWDGARITKLSVDGSVLDELELPVLRPTNCKLVNEEKELVITSATDGLSKQCLVEYPLSGKTFTQSLKK